MSTRNLPGSKGKPARGADSLTAFSEAIVYKMWEPRLLTTLRAFTACYRDSFTFISILFKIGIANRFKMVQCRFVRKAGKPATLRQALSSN
jgi:hypothetical protein